MQLKLFEAEGMFKVEKIKVAGWTYMAACGLDLARSEHVNTQTNFRNSSLLPNGRRSHYNNNSCKFIREQYKTTLLTNILLFLSQFPFLK